MKPRVVLVHSELRSYRVKLFDLLSKLFSINFVFLQGTREADRYEEARTWRYRYLPGRKLIGYAADVAPGIAWLLLKERNSFDVVIFSGIFSFTTHMGVPIAKLLRKKVVVWDEAWLTPRSWKGLVIRPLATWISRAADAVIVSGSRAREFHLAFGAKPEKIFTAPNAAQDLREFVDQTTIAPLRKRLGVSPSDILIGYLGRVVSIKNPDALVKAFAEIRPSNPAVKLLLVGDGDYAEEIRTLITQLGDERIIWIGGDPKISEPVPREDFVKYLSCCDIFVLPGRFEPSQPTPAESWGLTINEAMSLSKPVVASRSVGGSVDLIEVGKNGYIVEPDDPHNLAKILCDLAIDRKRLEKMGQRSREIIDKKFNYKQMIRGFEKAINYACRCTCRGRTSLTRRLQKSYRQHRLVFWASAFFLLVQLAYSYLIWHRSGNLPPNPGDSYNYLVNVHQIGIGGEFITDPKHLIYGGFNFAYALIAKLLHISPLATYELMFFAGKAILLLALIYFLRGFFNDDRKIALGLLVLGVYAGTGEAHGFFWVVPSFWVFVVLLVLLGAAKRGAPVLIQLLLGLMLVFLHPLGAYVAVPVIALGLVSLAFRKESWIWVRKLAPVLFLAILLQQAYISGINKLYFSPESALTKVTSIGGTFGQGVIEGIDPHGQVSLAERLNARGQLEIGLLTPKDIFSKLNSSVPKEEFSLYAEVPSVIYRIVPALYHYWNAYAFFLVGWPVLLPVLLALIWLILVNAWKKQRDISALFVTSLVTAVGSAIHPQGYRFLVVVWPLTLLALVEYLSDRWPNFKIPVRRFWQIVVSVYLLALLGYGVALTHRISLYQDLTWRRECANELSQRVVSPGSALFYSGKTLAPTVFIGEGLYKIPGVEQKYWSQYLAQEGPKLQKIVYVFDQGNQYYPKADLAKQFPEQARALSAERGRNLIETNCGYFSILEEE